MGFEHIAFVREAALAPVQKLVLYALASRADSRGRCWPSIERLCRDTGLSRRAVQIHLGVLVRHSPDRFDASSRLAIGRETSILPMTKRFAAFRSRQTLAFALPIGWGYFGGIRSPKWGYRVALTDFPIRRSKPRERAYKLYDEKGLYLLVSPTGAKLWRLKYRVAGTEKTLALGVYPERTLVPVRDDTHEARKLIRDGVDPSAQRKAERRAQRISAENTFEVLAREWHTNQSGKWTPGHGDTMLRRIETHLFPDLGKLPIADIEAPELLDALRGIERRSQERARGSNEIAHRMLQVSGQIFRYAVATGRAKRDPSGALRGALKAKV